MDVNDTLSVCQNSISMAEDIKNLLMKFERYVDEGDLQEAEKYVDEIKKDLGENHPKVTWAEETLELEKIPLGD